MRTAEYRHLCGTNAPRHGHRGHLVNNVNYKTTLHEVILDDYDELLNNITILNIKHMGRQNTLTT